MNRKSFLCLLALIGALLSIMTRVDGARAFPKDGASDVKKGVLIAAFGSSMPEGEAAINAVYDAVKAEYPDMEVRVAYTSRIIMRKIARESGRAIDEPAIALAKMAFEGFTDVVVLSTHIIPGEEYEDLKSVVDGFRQISENAPKAGFRRISLTSPLLLRPEDFEKLAGALVGTYGKQAEKGAVAFVGHGTRHFADAAYSALQMALWRKSPAFFVGTIEGVPAFDDVLQRLKAAKIRNVLVAPLMLVAGDHANNDIAGAEDDSWKSLLESEGYKVTPLLEGLGQNKAVRSLMMDKLREAWREIDR